MRVFLSYAIEDRQVARSLAKGLSDSGHDVYPNARWPKDVVAALNRAQAFVVLLSPAAIGSPFVGQEIRLALVSPQFENRVIPVVVEPTTKIPWILETMQPITAPAMPADAVKAVNERLQHTAHIATR